MAETVYRGPAMSIGPLMGNVTTTAGTQVALVEPTDGPGIEYQANTFPDPRFSPFSKDSLSIARIPVWLNSPYVVMADGVPQATSATAVAGTQAGTTTTLTLVTTAPGGGAAGVASTAIVPLIPMSGQLNNPFPNAGAVQQVLGIDLGFTTGNTNGTTTISGIPDTTVFYVGQWICVGGGGNAGGTTSLITQVATIASATSITTTTAALSTISNSPISSANKYQPAGAGFFPFTQGTSAALATSVNPYLWTGVGATLNPLEGMTRNVTVTSAAGATATSVTVAGFDIYGMAMHEQITVTVGGITAGKKAFKYIASATLNAADAGHNYSVGLGNLAGFNIRSDRWEYTNLFYKGTFLTSNNGYLAAVTTTATATTGDVRGTIDVSNASGFNQPFNGNTTTGRVTWMMSVPLYNLVTATPNNTNSLTGVVQF